MERGEPVEQPATIRFSSETQLIVVFNRRAYRLLRVIRDDQLSSMRETARLVGRDKEILPVGLTALEAVGAIRFETEGPAKRPVFSYDDRLSRPRMVDIPV